MTNDALSPEEAFVRSFVLPGERRRLLWLLSHGPERRAEFLDRLNHWISPDPRYAQLLKGRQSLTSGVEQLLRSKGSPEEVHVVSDGDREIDGRRMPLGEAIRRLRDTGFGGLVSCIPGRLVYYQMEAGENSYLLERMM